MRAFTTPVVLSSMVLGGWLTSAAAQEVAPPGTPPAQDLRSTEQGKVADNLPPGVIRQPSENEPGLVTGVTLGELHTDNLRLAGGDRPQQSSWITTVQPFVKAAYSGPRLSGMLDYRLTGYQYVGDVHTRQLAQHLKARGTLNILPQHLFLDGTAFYGRQVINDRLPSGSGTFYLGGNQANVASATLSPYWMQKLGRAGMLTLRYTKGWVTYNRDGIRGHSPDPDRPRALAGIPDVSSDTVQFSLVSPKDERWGWDLEYAAQRMKPDRGRDLKFARAQLGVSRQVGNHVRVLANVGKENKYRPDGRVETLGAPFWEVGVTWSNSRNRFKVTGGHRFYGRSAFLSWVHEAARLTTTIKYEETPTDLNQQLLNRNPTQMLGDLDTETPIPSLFERHIYLMKRATARVGYQMPHGRLELLAYDESRDYLLRDTGREKIANARLSWMFQLGPHTTLTPGIGWRRYRFTDGQVTYRRYGRITAVHQFNPHDFVKFQWRNESSNVYSPVPGAHDYRVNVFYVSWTHLF